MKTQIHFKNAYGTELTTRRHIELLLMLLCLELIVAFSSFGYINISPISMTTLHILVIVAAMYFGPWDAMAVAIVFAGTSIWTASVKSYEYGDIIFSPFISGKPFESLVMAVGTRLLFALIAGLLFWWFFSKERRHRKTGIAVIAIVATIIHSALISICMYAFFNASETDPGISFWQTLLFSNIAVLLITVVVVLLFDFFMRSNRENSKSFRSVYAFIIGTLLVLSAACLISQSGMLSKTPTVEAVPENCYEDTLHVITDDDYMPYSFYDENGNKSGHDVEMIALIANNMHMNLDLEFLPWDEAIEEAVNGRADVLMTCDYSDTFAGADTLLMTEPVSTDDFIVYAKTKIDSVDSLYNMKCAVMENGNVLAQIKMLNLNNRCMEYSNNREAMKALEREEADCAIMRYTVGVALIRELGYGDISGTISIGQSNVCFGITGNNEKLLNRINESVEALKSDGTAQELHDKWLTTFIHKYSIKELLYNNSWLLVVIMLLIVAILFSEMRNERRKQQAEQEKNRYKEIIDNLADDFECVNYIEIHDNKLDDDTVLLRKSDTLIRNIPGWETETKFTKRLEAFMDAAIAPEDIEDFRRKTRRETILSNLQNDDTYFVNFRAILDGEPCYYQLKFSTVKDEDGNVNAIVLGVHDTDEQTKKEIADREALQAARIAAESASKSKTNFLFNMSHDIRTPMNAITGFTNMAIKHIDEREKVLDCLEKTQKAGSMLLSLINSVLEVSRIESGNAVLEEKPGDVYYSFVNFENTMHELAEAKGITLTFEFGEIRDKFVFADFSRCMRVFVNVISNAIKFTNEGGFVKVRCEQLGEAKDGYGTYQYTISDNGIGMSEEFQKHVFEQFSREKTATVSGIQGTGLGMAVVKSFTELMGGTVSVQSKQGEGTTFTIIIPFKLQEHELYTDPNTGEVVSVDMEASSMEVIDFNGKSVLLVEDNELNREIAIEILTEEGLIVEDADDGTKAVEMLKEKGPEYYDFILMDIQMPEMNGYEATRAIREMYPDADIPIIALSANAFAEDRVASMEAGMNDHVAKPIDVEELFNVLAKYL